MARCRLGVRRESRGRMGRRLDCTEFLGGVMCEIGVGELGCSGMQHEEIADRAGIAMRLETGGDGAARALARGRVVVKFCDLHEAGMHGTSAGGLREGDKTVPASVGRPRAG